MNLTFYDGHDELYHRVKFGEDRTTRAGCRCENMVFVFFYRQDAAKRHTAGIKFTQRPKIRFFTPQGRLVAPIHDKNLAGPTGTWVRLPVQTFTLIVTGVGMRSQKYQKIPLFGKESPRRGDSLDRFRNFLGILYA